MNEQTKNGCQCENAGCGCGEVRADSCGCGADCACGQACACEQGCGCPARQSAQ